MACTERSDKNLKDKAMKELNKQNSPLERLRLQCLSRGATGIIGIGRQFRIIDDDGNKKLDFREFCKGCRDFGVDLTKEEMKEIFDHIDVDNGGTIDFDEFLAALRPPMSKSRLDIVNKAFMKLDKTKDGVITTKHKTCGSYYKFSEGQVDFQEGLDPLGDPLVPPIEKL